jgi:hypothetical protein
MSHRQLDFTNLEIRRIISHVITEKDLSLGHSDVKYSEKVIKLASIMEATLLLRIQQVLGRKKGGLYLDVYSYGAPSFFDYAVNAIKTTEEQFIGRSKKIADLLASSQKIQNIPVSYLLIIDAYDPTCANDPVFIVIKAESQNAFRYDGEGIDLVENLFLSTDQALYKVGVLYKDKKSSGDYSFPNTEYSAFVYDQRAEEQGQFTKYFYEKFLGFSVEKHSAMRCKEFYDRTTKFIQLNIASGPKQAEILDALRHEFAKESTVIKPHEFARDNFNEGQLRTLFISDVANKLPNSISKDLSMVKKALQRVNYSIGGMRLTGSGTDYSDNVKFIKTREQLSQLTLDDDVTIVVIKGKVKSAE